MAKFNKHCHVCGKEYQYCTTCQYTEPVYKELVCSEECNSVWQILSKNGVGLMPAKETLEALSKVKMPANLLPGIKAHIDSLKAAVKPAPAVVKAPVEAELAEIVIEEPQAEPVVEEPAKVYKKQKKVIVDEVPSQE